MGWLVMRTRLRWRVCVVTPMRSASSCGITLQP